jgi:hypothetical protein
MPWITTRHADGTVTRTFEAPQVSERAQFERALAVLRGDRQRRAARTNYPTSEDAERATASQRYAAAYAASMARSRGGRRGR